MRQHTVSIDILDKSYQVACEPEQEAELKQAANDLDDQMRAIRSTGKVIGLERVAIMAALNLSHQVLVMKSGGQPEDPLEEQLKTITSRIDEALFQLRQFEIS
ncbi:MAG: cell division protein ZapA [Luminiphilus sp.]|mgnify:FL=1|jgi:cell division protein ZapA|uniref:Cell division protein ZapA n=1 Tax=Candidatus Paraluminiphilus aquimaris TaxID=2518994 RepID=A0ABY6Q3P4_9GAMM|nr:cell division protein ZapA [Candidatus Paraluminiphilus aquimaris]MAJ54170.1 cell division protein ZapA [Halieaceae bacterium]MCH1458976.1 cell division protein ZapA [Luminiphilus sp.]OUU97435.1 MAG: cell division protein ZapA [Cellvibrionales bacterium TMED79]UZP73629.1 cell division protein ZapA [Candidatus Paraluminiphilus aquimaris]